MTNVANAQELKGLQVQLERERATAAALKQELSTVQRKHHLSQNACKTLEARIAELQATAVAEPIVSEHALLRYLERIKGVDLEALRAEILGDGTAANISFAQNGCIKKGNANLVVRNNVVVTVK